MEHLPDVIIIAAIILVIIGFAIGLTIRSVKNRRKKREVQEEITAKKQEAQRALSRIDNAVTTWTSSIFRAFKTPGADIDIVEVGPPPEGWERSKHQADIAEALKIQLAAQERVDAIKARLDAFASLRSEPDDNELILYNKIDEMLEKYSDDTTEEDLEWTEVKLAELMSLYSEEQLHRARLGDKESLKELIRLTREKLLKRKELPEDWKELVARFIKNPSLKDFGLSSKSPKTGTLRLRAESAITRRQFTEAKIILAYCNDTNNPQNYAEVGMIFATDLAIVVGRERGKHISEKDSAAQTA
ncbi:MAG: hypothetical protein JWN12_814 [Candidatus Saccharibacteria bacterium]|nr:hypothetical protein [Candidatus Saccharibacteria bacterium]